MSALAVSAPFPTYPDINGDPLDNGSIYIGVAGLPAALNPINVYFDEALTQLAAQPIATRGGYPVNNGVRSRLFVNSDYSIQVLNSKGTMVYQALQSTDVESSDQVTFLRAGANAVQRTVQSKLRDVVSVKDFGAVGDGVTDDYSAIAAALATGFPIYFPKTSVGTYLIGTSITTSNGTQILIDDDVVIHYTGSTGAAINLVGAGVKATMGEIFAPNAPYAIRYYNLEFSEISVRRAGACTSACIYHDGDLQTSNAGNNRWIVEDIQAGSVPYGIRIKNSTIYILEGEIWDVKVIFSATNTAVRIGEAAISQLCRWNTYQFRIDAQGITPLLIDVYQDSNNIKLINWAGLVVPPIAHVRFNAGTGNNIFWAGTGVQDPLQILDSGANFTSAQGQAGQRILNGQVWVNLPAGGGTTAFQVGDNASSGDTIASIENTSNANNTTKYVAFSFRGRDTANAGKDVAQIRSAPQDIDWVNATTILYGRNADALAPYAFLGINGTPEGVVTAPVGAVATRRDGGAGTTFYVKESGTGNTGWVAK